MFIYRYDTQNIYPKLSLRRMMPECQNCGAFVTTAYARVFTPPGETAPRVCPDCPDMVRDGADVRKARATRN